MSTVELTLAVSDVARAARFYRLLFGGRLAHVARSMARFEPPRPTIAVTLRRGPTDAAAEMRFCADAADVARIRERLRRGGVVTSESGRAPGAGWLPREIAASDPAGHVWHICVAHGPARRHALRLDRLHRPLRAAISAIVELARAGAVDRAYAASRRRDEQVLRRYGTW